MICGVRWYSILLKEREMFSCNQVFKKMASTLYVLHVNAKLQFQKKLPSNCRYTHHTPHTNFSIMYWNSMDLCGVLYKPVCCIL